MPWHKRNLWKVGISIPSMLLLLAFLVCTPVKALAANERALGSAMPTALSVQITPTVDATVTALNKKQLTLQVKQLQNQNSWVSNNSTALIAAFATIVVALFGISQWAVNRRDERRKEKEAQDKELEDRKDEREKRVEERFQAAVTGLGDEKEGSRIGAAILLKTFLRPGYEQFYTQIFQLVAANLSLPITTKPPEDPAAPLPLTALRHALMMTFMEAFPLARDQEKKNVGTRLADNEYKVRSTHPAPVTISSTEIHSLNALRIRLDNGFFWYADLKQAWMAYASLRKTDLTGADLSGVNLYEANLSEAYLWETNLSGATLWRANLYKADLRGTDLSKATLLEANLSGASLQNVNLSGADLSEARLSGAKFSKVNPEDALSLTNTDLRGVEGLKKEQLEACKAKGAIIDEGLTTSSPPSTAASPPPEPRDDAQAPLAPPVQGSTPPSDADS